MSAINEQLQESLDQIDIGRAEKRIGAILGNKGPQPLPEPQKAARKRRSDAGVPKKPPSNGDEIMLRVTVDVARSMATSLAETFPSMSTLIQDQIIQQLQKKIDVLSRAK